MSLDGLGGSSSILIQVSDSLETEQLWSLDDDVTHVEFLQVSRVASCGKQPLSFPCFTLSPSLVM